MEQVSYNEICLYGKLTCCLAAGTRHTGKTNNGVTYKMTGFVTERSNIIGS